MNKAEVENLWKAFSVFDADGSGTISPEELAMVMKSLGQDSSPEELRDLIKEVDIDLSGSIDFEEFKALMIDRQGDRQSRLELAFSVFDKDNSGRITVDEMHSVMSQFELTDSELEEMIKEVDQDGDGSINFEEFCQLMPDETETDTGTDTSSLSFPVSSTSSTLTTNPQKSIPSEKDLSESEVKETRSSQIAAEETSADPQSRINPIKRTPCPTSSQ